MNYKIIFNIQAYNKLCLYVGNTEGEISGLGKIKKITTKDETAILIEDIILLNQVSSWGGTKLDKEAITKFLDDLMKKGEAIADWKLWWHSHGDMDTFWSTTDEDTIESLNTEQTENNWWLSIVANKGGEMKARIDVFEPFLQTIDIDSFVFFTPSTEALKAKIIKEIEKKVKKPSFEEKKEEKIEGRITSQESKGYWVKDAKGYFKFIYYEDESDEEFDEEFDKLDDKDYLPRLSKKERKKLKKIQKRLQAEREARQKRIESGEEDIYAEQYKKENFTGNDKNWFD